MSGSHMLGVVVALMLFAQDAMAQRRGDGASAKRLELKMSKAFRFGEATVPAGRYVVNVAEGTLSLTNASSMTLVATLPATVTQVEQAVATPTVELLEKGNEATVVVKSLDRIWTSAKGQVMTDSTGQTSLVSFAKKSETQVAGGVPQEKSAVDLVEGALVRLLPTLKHCADQAQKARWTTDDVRFVRCVCPLVDKWRLPKIAAPVRLHRPLHLGKSGLSFTATEKGKTQDCRVWVGIKSPEEMVQPQAMPVSAPVVMPAP